MCILHNKCVWNVRGLWNRKSFRIFIGNRLINDSCMESEIGIEIVDRMV